MKQIKKQRLISKKMNRDPLRAVDIKQHNQNMILSYIHNARNKGGISQSDLVNLTGLKAPSVFRIFSALENEGYIRRYKAGSTSTDNLPDTAMETKKGRKPCYYTICNDALYTIGIEFWAACLSLGVFNFNGDRIHSTLINLPCICDADQMVDKITLMVNNAIEVLGLPREKIIGVGIAAPGKVDINKGRVVFYHRINGMSDYPLRDKLEKMIDLPILVHNNCSAIAYNNYKYENPSDNKSLFSFLLRSGVNGALVSKGRIYVASDGTTLEAGHLPINFEGPKCSCGLNGCLQAYMFELGNRNNPKEENLTLFENLEQPLVAGDHMAQKIIEEASFYMYMAIKNIIRMLGSESFLITSGSLLVSQSLCDAVEKLFDNESDSLQTSKPTLSARKYDVLMAQRGASDLVLDHYFSIV